MTRFAQGLALAIAGRYRTVLLVSAICCALAIWRVGHLHIDTDLRGLLPDDHQVVVSLEKIERDFGPLGSLNMVVAHGDKEVRHAFADALAQKLHDSSLLRGVDYRVPKDFFSAHALYYLSDAEMAELTGLVESWQHAELCQASPTLCVEKPDLSARTRLKEFVASRKSKLREKIGFEDYYEREGIDALAMFALPAKSASDLAFAGQVSQQVRQAAQDVFSSSGPWTGTDLRYNIVGPYTARADEASLVRGDMLKAGLLACAGVICLLYYLFRSWRAIWTLLLPLLAGVAWSLGATQLLLGRLNTMTSLISSMLLGVGIDAGIHLYGTLQQECQTHGVRDALVQVYRRLLAPLVTAAATTVAAFCAMAYSGFPAFHEFGVIAAMGVILCILAMLTVFPAMVCWLGVAPPVAAAHLKLGNRLLRATLRRPGLTCLAASCLAVICASAALRDAGSMFEWNGRQLQSDAARERSESDVFLISEIMGHDVHAGIITLDTFEKATAMAAHAKALHQQADAKTTTVAAIVSLNDVLPPADIDMQQRANAIAALDRLFTPRLWQRLAGDATVVADVDHQSPEGVEDDEFGDFAAIEPSVAQDGESPRDEPAEPDDADDTEDEFGEFIPLSPDQTTPPKLKETGDRSQDPSHIPKAEVAGEDEQRLSAQELADLRTMLAAKPFSQSDLPQDILRKFIGADGSYAVIVQTAFDSADMRRAVDYISETSAYSAPFTSYTIVAESTVYAAMLLLMGKESPFILGMTMLIILVCVYIQVRSLSRTLLVIAPLVVGLCWLFGVMWLVGVKLTLFNVPILPAILGIGVDNAVYLGAAIGSLPRNRTRADVRVVIGHTGQAIFYATTTTIVGFGAFLVADSGGLRSIGALAVIGIATAAASAFIVLPTASVWRSSLK